MRHLIVITVVVLALFLLTHASAGTAAAAPLYHVVRPGQTLSSIAWAYGVTTYAVAAANGIWNPNYVYVGQVLVIPYGGYPYPYPRYYPSPVLYYPRPTYGCYYYVRYGDTMLNIAARYGKDAWTIARANGIYNLNWIWAGQRLFIPGCSTY